MHQAFFKSADDLRSDILTRATAFSELTKMPKSTIGKEAMNDPAFLSDVEAERNLTFKAYQRVMDWFDANWPDQQRGVA